MKKNSSLCIATVAALLVSGPLVAQTVPATSAPPATAATADAGADSLNYIEVGPKKQKFVLVSQNNSIQSNYEFQQNVQKVRLQRQQIIELNNRHKIALTDAEKFALKRLIDGHEKSLRENDAKMREAYGFSLAHNYLIQVLKSRAYVRLSDEEYKKLTDDEKKRPDYIIARPIEQDGKEVLAHFRQFGVIDGVKANQQFSADNEVIQNLTRRIAEIKAAKEQTQDEATLKKLDELLAKDQEELLKRSDAATTTYGFNPTTPAWILQYEQIELRVAASDEDFERWQKEKAARAAAGAKPAGAQ